MENNHYEDTSNIVLHIYDSNMSNGVFRQPERSR